MEASGFTILIVLIVSFFISFLAVVSILKLSYAKKWFDPVNDRKIHDGNIPRLAGIGFAAAFFVVALVVHFLFLDTESNIRYLPCFLALFIILFFGIFDDFRPLAPRYKLLVQIIAALIVVIPGYMFRHIAYLDFGLLPEPFGFAITMLWIVGITNAINLIDGIDGLAGGLSCFIAVFFGAIFFTYGNNPLIVLFCVALVGVILGFLIFNAPLPKAKIFMGDCGSQFLGFMLALLPLLVRHESPAVLPVPYASALLLIPIFDTIAAVWRRIRDRKPIDTPDKSHIHHKLMNLGLSVLGVNAVLCGLQIILGTIVFISIRLEGLLSLYVLGIAYIMVIIFFSTIHFMNRAVSKKGLLEGQIESSS